MASNLRPTDTPDLFKVNGLQVVAYRRVGKVRDGAQFLVLCRRQCGSYVVADTDLERDYLEVVAWADSLRDAATYLETR